MVEVPRRDLPDRLYARFGWKVWPLIAGSFWLLGLVLSEGATLNLYRVQPISHRELIGLALWVAAICTVSGTCSAIFTVRACAPLRHALDHGTDLTAGWNAVVALPIKISQQGLILVTVWAAPAAFIGVGHVYGIEIPLLVITALGVLMVTSVTATGVIYGAAAVVRPFLAELRRLGARPGPQTVTLRARLIMFIPSLSIGATATGAVLAQPSGTRITTSTVIVILATTAFALVAWTPVTVMFAHSVLTPLANLQAATERIKRGDYTQPVPEAWADELGAVATSLNEAMATLSERQQMAREVRESRARIVAAADASRKRIERNIHDGAQQRLVALALDVRMLESMAATMSADELCTAHQQLAEGLKEALAELRDLARGLHPAILTTDGLRPALQQLATRAKLPVTVTVPAERFPEHVETTAYFVAAEALANVGKYAHASGASVAAAQLDGHLRVEIADDGIGGANPTSGSGLSGLVDRVAAIGGRLTVESPRGGGTRIVADLPLVNPLLN
ncbi:MAG: HAMP domain-containing protein [Nocardiaceae bacterium]|nr:HAMP domain-containing protein [Nocardiaceae bacterium]